MIRFSKSPRYLGVLLVSVFLAVSCNLRDKRCRELHVEVAVPRDSGSLRSYDLVTPETMSGHGAPEIVRSDEENHYYEFETLVYNDETRRDFVINLSDGRSAVFSLPGGPEGTALTSSWASPTYIVKADYAAWNVMRGKTMSPVPASVAVRLRFRFSAGPPFCGQ